MEDRNDSEVRQHETLPGPGPGTRQNTARHNTPFTASGGGRPVEQMVDAAIERIAREHGLSRLGSEPVETTPLSERPSKPRTPTRLRWKGLDVSDEFRSYAERIARGEELPPFEGRVLAEPNPAFPWGTGGTEGAPGNPRGTRLALWGTAAVVAGLLVWSVALKLDAPDAGNAAVASALPESVATRAASGSTLPPASDVVTSQRAEPEVAQLALIPAAPVATSTVEAAAPSTLPSTQLSSAVASSNAISSADKSVAPGVAPSAVSTPAAHAALAAAPSAAASGIPAAPAPVAALGSTAGAPASSSATTPGGLQAAIGTMLATRASEGPAPAPAARSAADEFGIMDPGFASASGASPAAPVLGSVGDLSRQSPASGADVRKEPGSESSAKGSLLVETPSF